MHAYNSMVIPTVEASLLSMAVTILIKLLVFTHVHTHSHQLTYPPTAPSPIDVQTIRHEVTFSTDFTPMLHINFTVSTCYNDIIAIPILADK